MALVIKVVLKKVTVPRIWGHVLYVFKTLEAPIQQTCFYEGENQEQGSVAIQAAVHDAAGAEEPGPAAVQEDLQGTAGPQETTVDATPVPMMEV